MAQLTEMKRLVLFAFILGTACGGVIKNDQPDIQSEKKLKPTLTEMTIENDLESDMNNKLTRDGHHEDPNANQERMLHFKTTARVGQFSAGAKVHASKDGVGAHANVNAGRRKLAHVGAEIQTGENQRDQYQKDDNVHHYGHGDSMSEEEEEEGGEDDMHVPPHMLSGHRHMHDHHRHGGPPPSRRNSFYGEERNLNVPSLTGDADETTDQTMAAANTMEVPEVKDQVAAGVNAEPVKTDVHAGLAPTPAITNLNDVNNDQKLTSEQDDDKQVDNDEDNNDQSSSLLSGDNGMQNLPHEEWHRRHHHRFGHRRHHHRRHRGHRHHHPEDDHEDNNEYINDAEAKDDKEDANDDGGHDEVDDNESQQPKPNDQVTTDANSKTDAGDLLQDHNDEDLTTF